MSYISFVWQVFSFQQLPETSWTIEGEPEFSFLDLVIPAGLSMSQQCLYPKLSNRVEIYEPMSLRFFDSLHQCYLWSTYCVPVAGLVTGHWRFKDEWAHLFQPKSLESMSNTDNPSPSPITVTVWLMPLQRWLRDRGRNSGWSDFWTGMSQTNGEWMACRKRESYWQRKSGMRNSGTFSDPALVNWAPVQDWETVQEAAKTSSWRAPSPKSRTVFAWGSLQWLPTCYRIKSRTLGPWIKTSKTWFCFFHIVVAKRTKYTKRAESEDTPWCGIFVQISGISTCLETLARRGERSHRYPHVSPMLTPQQAILSLESFFIWYEVIFKVPAFH